MTARNVMDISLSALVSVALGIGLAAATGFRVFLPLLAASIAAHTGHLPLAEGFQWLGTTPALVTLGAAALFETLAYYVPGVDHLLDVLASPAAVIAGIVASAAVITDLPPGVLWPVAIIGGGGVAGLTKGSAALLRAKSGLMTGGLSNPVVSTAETVGATGLSIFAIALPVICFVVVLLVLVWVLRKAGRLVSRKRGKPSAPGEEARPGREA
jgi:hypothetical protein